MRGVGLGFQRLYVLFILRGGLWGFHQLTRVAQPRMVVTLAAPSVREKQLGIDRGRGMGDLGMRLVENLAMSTK